MCSSSNGEMLIRLQRIMEGEETIPANVANQLILAAVVQSYRLQGEIKSIVYKLDDRVRLLESAKISESKLDEQRDLATVKWPYLWEKFGVEIIKYIVVAIIALIIYRLGGSFP